MAVTNCLCHDSAALGDSSSSIMNSPRAKDVVLAALHTAGKEAGLKVIICLHSVAPLVNSTAERNCLKFFCSVFQAHWPHPGWSLLKNGAQRSDQAWCTSCHCSGCDRKPLAVESPECQAVNV